MVNVFEFDPVLVQPFFAAVIVIVLTISKPVKLFGAVYPIIFPEPLATNPIAVLVFVQLNTSLPPVLAVKFMVDIAPPEHTDIFVTAVTTG